MNKKQAYIEDRNRTIKRMGQLHASGTAAYIVAIIVLVVSLFFQNIYFTISVIILFGFQMILYLIEIQLYKYFTKRWPNLPDD